MGDEPEEEGERSAEEKASDDGKVESGVFAAVNDVPREFAQAKGEFATEIEKAAKKDEKAAEKEQRAAEFAKRVHSQDHSS
jgi:hypothetical protein